MPPRQGCAWQSAARRTPRFRTPRFRTPPHARSCFAVPQGPETELYRHDDDHGIDPGTSSCRRARNAMASASVMRTARGRTLSTSPSAPEKLITPIPAPPLRHGHAGLTRQPSTRGARASARSLQGRWVRHVDGLVDTRVMRSTQRGSPRGGDNAGLGERGNPLRRWLGRQAPDDDRGNGFKTAMGGSSRRHQHRARSSHYRRQQAQHQWQQALRLEYLSSGAARPNGRRGRPVIAASPQLTAEMRRGLANDEIPRRSCSGSFSDRRGASMGHRILDRQPAGRQQIKCYP